jgi:hypothetical protein
MRGCTLRLVLYAYTLILLRVLVTMSSLVIPGSVEVCSWLLDQAGERRQDLVRATTWSQNTPLMWAAWSGSLDVLILFLEAGADPRHGNNRKQNAAHWAAAAGQFVICQYLYDDKLGLDILEKQDDAGRTPLDYAELYNRDVVATWLHEVLQQSEADN